MVELSKFNAIKFLAISISGTDSELCSGLSKQIFYLCNDCQLKINSVANIFVAPQQGSQ